MTTTDLSSMEHAIGETGRFHLRQMSGEIRIRGIDGGVVRIRDREGRNLSDAFQVEAGDGALSLTAPDGFGLGFAFGRRGRTSMDLDVDVPRRATVSIETASAELDGEGLQGETKVRTASGDIDLVNLAGKLELEAVSGEVKIIAVAALDLRARTISGDMTIRAPRLGRAELASTSGDIRLDAALSGAGPFGIETVSGDATIVGRTGIRVEARTVTGDLRSDLPHRKDAGPGRKALIVGDGGTPVVFKSVSGDLRVAAPRDPLPVERGATGAPVPPAPPVPPLAPDVAAPPAPPVEPVAPVPPVSEGRDDWREVARLDILRALEHGAMSVEAAMQRLAEIEEA